MKKLMTILVLFAMCGVAMAKGPNNPPQPPPNGGNNNGGNNTAISGTDSAEVQIPLTKGDHPYINFQNETTQGNSGLTYTVTENKWYNNQSDRLGHVYFTVMDQNALDQYNMANKTNMSKITVQFVGTYSESYKTQDWDHYYNLPYETNHTLEIADYGIYLYDPQTKTQGAFMSALTNNSIEIDPGKSFGVYYTGTQVDTITYTYYGKEYTLDPTRTNVTATSTGGYIGNFDTGNGEGEHAGQNKITVYSYDEDGVIEGTEDWTYKKYMCLFGTNDPINNRHWEFMLQTTLDDPKVIVRPEDVPEDIPASGQPLPGTLATLLIGGLCAGSLRKRNKKH